MPTPNRIRIPVTKVSAAYTAQLTDWVVLADPSSAAFAVTLPSPAAAYQSWGGNMSRVLEIKHSSASTNAVTVAPNGGTIDGTSSVVLSSREGVELVTDGTNWHVINATNVATGNFRTAVTAAFGTTTPIDINTVQATGNVIPYTPTQATTINAATVTGTAGQMLTFVITTSGTTSFTITFGTNFKSTGTLATGTVSGKVFTITFLSDGNFFNEISRTVAM